MSSREVELLRGNGPGPDREGASGSRPASLAQASFEELVAEIIRRLGEDPDRQGLVRTPTRVARSMELFTSGYAQTPEEVMTGALFQESHQNMVLVRNIEMYSLCEHHLLPFFGKVHVAYIPNGRIVGLSKTARIVNVFARRLQVQERLTEQIAQGLWDVVRPQGVGVIVEAHHLCMMMRGVEQQNSSTLTSAMRGLFLEDPRTREEFLALALKSGKLD